MGLPFLVVIGKGLGEIQKASCRVGRLYLHPRNPGVNRGKGVRNVSSPGLELPRYTLPSGLSKTYDLEGSGATHWEPILRAPHGARSGGPPLPHIAHTDTRGGGYRVCILPGFSQ